MSNSPLVSHIHLSPNCNSPRNHKIDMVVIHCMAGPMTVVSCGHCFAPVSRQASSNYGVDGDGRIGMYVEEKNRSWCTCSPGIDNRAITIEVANTQVVEPFMITEKAYEALINLLVDICRRNSISSLKWRADKALALAAERGGSVELQNMVVHRWFEAKSCPGSYLYSIHGKIAEEVNRRLAGNTPIRGLPTGVTIVGNKPTSTTVTTTTGTVSTSDIVVPKVEVDYKKLTPYLLTVPRGDMSVNYKKMKSAGVVGVMLEAGSLYTSSHVKTSKFMNANLPKQSKQVVSAGLRYALYMPARARSISEVNAEMDAFTSVVRKYPPSLGVWLNLNFSMSVSVNDTLMARYQKRLQDIGFKSKIGIYADTHTIKSIHWSKFKSSWVLWLDDHVKTKGDIDKLLDPDFFDMKGRYT